MCLSGTLHTCIKYFRFCLELPSAALFFYLHFTCTFFLQYKPFDLLIFLHQFSGRCATGTIYFTPISCLTNNRRHLYSPTKILCASSLNSHPQCYSRFFPLSTKSPCAFNGPEEQCWPCEGFPFVQGRGISQKQNLTNASQRQWIFVFQSVGKVGSELGGKSTLT